MVLSAVGLRPNIALAQEAGLETARGICTGLDHRSSDPSIFALGDCAEVNGQWAPYINPITQALPALVNNLLGQSTDADLKATPVLVKPQFCHFLYCQQWKQVSGEWKSTMGSWRLVLQ